MGTAALNPYFTGDNKGVAGCTLKCNLKLCNMKLLDVTKRNVVKCNMIIL